MSKRVIGTVGSLGLLLLLGAGAAGPRERAASDGWTFTWLTVTTTDAPGRHSTDTASLSVQMVRGRFRASLPAGAPDPTGMLKGGYMIFDSDSGTMTVVIPSQKTAMEVDLASLGALGGMIKWDVTDASSLTQDLGPGEQILGHPTRHVRSVRAYALRMSTPLDTSTSRIESETDAWRATDLAIGDPFELMGSRLAAAGQGLGLAGLPGLVSKDTIPKGVTLRAIVKSKTTDSKGRSTTTVMSTEVRDLQRAKIETEALAVPAEYRTINPMKTRKPFTKEQRETFMRNCQQKSSKAECEQRLKWMDPGAAADTGKAAS
jgi:hypothetical protein